MRDPGTVVASNVLIDQRCPAVNLVAWDLKQTFQAYGIDIKSWELKSFAGAKTLDKRYSFGNLKSPK